MSCPTPRSTTPKHSSQMLEQLGAYLSLDKHDDVIKWKHFPRYWPFVRGIHRSPVNSPHKGQWRGALMFTLICAQINGWVNNHEAGDLRRYHAHYDFIVMMAAKLQTINLSEISSMKTDWLIFFHWTLFLVMWLRRSHHWFRYWLGAEQGTCHYLNQWWPNPVTYIWGTMGRWVNSFPSETILWWPWLHCCVL